MHGKKNRACNTDPEVCLIKKETIVKATRLVIFILCLSSAPSALAEQWDWKITPYFWASAITGDTQLGPVSADVDVKFSDIVDRLNVGALLHIEAHKERYLLSADLLYLALEANDSFSPTGGDTDADLDSLILEGSYVFKHNTDSGFRGFEAGLRYWDFDLKLQPALLATIARSTNWVDAFIGYRVQNKLANNWSYMAKGNIGGGGADSSWALELSFQRQLSSGNSLSFGYRALNVDYETTTGRGLPFKMDVTFHGIVIGYIFD